MSNSPVREEAKSASLHCLPSRIRGDHAKNFRQVKVVSNHYYLSVPKIEKLVIFAVKFFPFVPNDNSKLRMDLLQKQRKQL